MLVFFYAGLADVTIDEKQGFINKKNEIVFEYKCKRLSRFDKRGLACVSLDGKMHGLINQQGILVLEPEFEEIYPASVSENLYAVKYQGKWGCICVKKY